MKNYIKIALTVIFITAVVCVLKFTPLSYYFFDPAGREMFVVKFEAFMDNAGPWAPVLFVLFYAATVICFLPASLATSIGGLVFGKWYGLLLNVTAAMIGGSISFLTARYLLRDTAAKLLEAGHFKKLDDRAGEHGFSVIVYLRLLFVPFTYLNYAAGISKIKFSDFAWGTLAGVVPGLLVVTFFASAIKELMLTYKSPLDLIQFNVIFPLALFIFSFFIPVIVKRFRKRFYVTKNIEKEVGNE
ncbi:MAG: VTT domain-containing protein [Spirochaetia bacterium]|nr:VTT domain-containing protein [Spirochaetia bacterium]